MGNLHCQKDTSNVSNTSWWKASHDIHRQNKQRTMAIHLPTLVHKISGSTLKELAHNILLAFGFDIGSSKS